MGLLGGGKSTTIPATGFYAQPKAYQDLYSNLSATTNAALYGPYGSGLDTFRPQDFNGGEKNAMNSLYQGFAPTQQSMQQDVGMFMNPYEQNVIDGMNRESQGQNSLVNQAALQAGQMGSNRSFLSTSDVEQNRVNNIGQMRSGQYNTAVNNVLNGLIPQRQQDAQNALTAGGMERELNLQQKQAPLNFANAGWDTLNRVPTEFGNFGSKEQIIKTKGGGLGSLLKTAAPFIGMATGMPWLGAVAGGIGGGMDGGGLAGAAMGAYGGYSGSSKGGGLANAAQGGRGGYSGSTRFGGSAGSLEKTYGGYPGSARSGGFF